MQVGTIVELWRYPVKSLPGERLTGPTAVSPAGIVGDRARAVRDEASGKILSAKTLPALLSADTTWDDGRLSEHVGRPVRLVEPTEGERSTIEMDLDEDDPSAGTVEFQTQPGVFYDSRSTLHLLSTQSLGDWDVRRFRPNLLVDAEGDHPEDAWVGHRLRLGPTVEATVRKRTSRCVLTTRAQPGGIERDLSVYRSLLATRDGDLGIYLDPVVAGTLTPGDPVVLLA